MFQDKFRETARHYPGTAAIVWQAQKMTYRELDQRSDALAIQLAAGGVLEGDIVPLRRERGAEWLAYSLGVIKAGASYAPVSAATPPERLMFIEQDTKTRLQSAEAMIVYYTSGSTGEPKGVMLSHEAVLEMCRSHCESHGFTHGIRAAVQADVGFDSFLLSTLPFLTVGGTLYIMDDKERLSLVGIHRFLMKNKIETTFLTTQLAVQYMKTFDNPYLKTLFTGGEALRAHTPRSYEVHNLYGPTECTVYVTAHNVKKTDEGDIPIGFPTGRNRVYIEGGELCVSGPQLALGYLNRPKETSERFVPNPHYVPDADAQYYALMYRTGDLAQWSSDGELLYRGRMDNQVKISGYRIELGEIETALLKHPSVSAAYVIVRYDENCEPFITAYCVAKEVATDALKAFLAQKLPEYMLPRRIVCLEQLPLNKRTGKVDIAALPQ